MTIPFEFGRNKIGYVRLDSIFFTYHIMWPVYATILLGAFLWEHFGRKLDLEYKPTYFINVISTLVATISSVLGGWFAHLSDFLSRVWSWIVELGETLWALVLSICGICVATRQFGTSYVQVVVDRFGTHSHLSIYIGSIILVNALATFLTWYFDYMDYISQISAGTVVVLVGVFLSWNATPTMAAAVVTAARNIFEVAAMVFVGLLLLLSVVPRPSPC